ncbi:Cilia- and flagella-associated protein 44 [Clydaea vesicula]|uniref:Cilia- and flagella-associated protein 44 n=1 Tax=Clydaea vesicula TaxID=447962 RepID=A0AAD5Y1U6_9FUNG|nr:Cilia- and flagella-associated protein 44 [Clydaea vesicula]
MSKSNLAEKQATSSIPDDFYYDAEKLKFYNLSFNEIEQEVLELHCSFGFDSHKRSNVHYLSDNCIVTSVGNLIVFLNLKSLEQEYYKALRNGGIGAIAIHPSRNYIAVAEVFDNSPLIYILEYPSMKVFRILRDGAIKGYSNISFNAGGNKLASVGQDPDFMLTIWDWKEEHIILRSKAFSQDVYRVAFANESDGVLTTSGTGHIKFWRMSSTFTGLKLQGYLGKFGASELTDICAFIQLPDGKVLSSTETGNLLLWDGGMIKCEISGKGRKPCHIGRIEVVLLVEGEIFTAAEDGYVRIWDLETIDNADVTTAYPGGAEKEKSDVASTSSSSNSRIFEMEPVDEILIGKDVKVKSMVRNPVNIDEYLIQDSLGHLFKLDTKKRTVEKLIVFHSGPIAGSDTSPKFHSMVTLGVDGTLRVFSYLEKRMIGKVQYPNEGSCIQYMPLLIDGGGSTVIAGFSDGIIRIITFGKYTVANGHEFMLQEVFKPHKSRITKIIISEDCEYFATVAEDKTVFFFNIQNLYKPELSFSTEMIDENYQPPYSKKLIKITPICFIETETPVNSISFSPDNHQNVNVLEDDGTESQQERMQESEDVEEDSDNNIGGRRLLMVLEDVGLMSMILPPTNSIDTSITYELSKDKFELIPWHFVVPDEKKKVESESIADEKVEEKVLGASEDREVKVVEEEKPELLIKENSPFQLVYYLEGGYFIGTIRNKKGKLMYTHIAAVTDLKLSSSGKYLLFGGADGTAGIRKFRVEDILLKDAENSPLAKQFPDSSGNGTISGEFWLGYAHDSSRGRIANLSNSFDDSFLVSVGADGGVVVWRNLMHEVKTVGKKLKNTMNFEILIFSDGQNEEFAKEETPDIDLEEDDEEEITISQERSKSKEEFKIEVVEDILDPNTYSIQEHKIKSEKDREIDEAEIKKQVTRNYIQDLRNEFLELLNQNEQVIPEWKLLRDSFSVDSDLRTDIEKETAEKIENLKKDQEWISEKESIGLHKTLKLDLSSLFSSNHDGTQEKLLQDVNDRNKTTDNQITKKLDSEEYKEQQGDLNGNKGQIKVLHDSRSKLEARKQLRAQRATLWKELIESKPDENYEDPRFENLICGKTNFSFFSDVANIRYAELHMGDYKLKTGEKYIVPESERVDADKKKRQLILLNESIFDLKENFNKQILHLRDNKQNLINKFYEYILKIETIDKKLVKMGETVEVLTTMPQMDPLAYPENRNLVTEEDIQYQLRLNEENAHTRTKEDFGGFANRLSAQKKEANAEITSAAADTELLLIQKPVDDSLKEVTSKSPLEILEYENTRTFLKYKKNRFLLTMEDALTKFDEKVENLVKEKILLDGDIKFADIKLLLLYREWALLKEFEKFDTTLADKLVTKKQEQDDIDQKIKECQDRLNIKKVEIEQVIKREKEIYSDFTKILGEGNKYEEFLTKILKRKIKRAKKKVKSEKVDGEEHEDESEEESDDEYGDGNDESDEEDQEEEICPNDCDTAVFNKVLELREKKLDEEEILSEIQKSIEALKKENESLIKKEKVIHVALKNTETEIQDFQTQKQKKLNELDVVVPLRLHQLYFLEKNALPADLSSALIFVEDGLRKLKNRIKELHQEKSDIKKNHKELKKMHISLKKSRKEKQLRLEDMEGRAYDVQMLKFGKVIDLEKLERMGVNKNAEELREKLLREDQKRLKELKLAEVQISLRKEKLTELIKDNTERLENKVSLTEQNKRLEDSLNTSQCSVTAEYNGPQKKDIIEKERLIKLVQLQSAEIEELKMEIELHIRKPVAPITSKRNAQENELH